MYATSIRHPQNNQWYLPTHEVDPWRLQKEATWCHDYSWNCVDNGDDHGDNFKDEQEDQSIQDRSISGVDHICCR